MPQALAAGLAYATAGLSVGAAATVVAVANVAINLAASYLVSTAISAITGSGSVDQQDINAEMALPTTTPVYRFPYGLNRITATPIAAPIRGDYAYGVWLISSRPSEGEFKLYLDEREVLLEGDPYDFTGSGATATEDPFEDHVNVWFGLGDQQTVPSIFTTEVPWAVGVDEELFKVTDIGKGLTVMWMRWKAGDAGERLERWPSTPPLVEIEGKFSKVYDPRDNSQSLEDNSTWQWSENQALVVLDTLTQNPFRPYQEKNLLMSSFEDAADVCDEVVTNKDNTTNARYTTAGMVIFDGSELEDLVEPILNAGASTLTRVAGRLGIVPGTYQESSYTLSDVIGDIKYSTQKAANDIPTQVKVSYTSRARNYETAELEPYDIPGALDEDGGVDKVVEYSLSWVPTATQAMRVRKILALKSRRQVSLEVMAPPSAIKLVGGATVTTDFPDPYSRLSREWTVMGTNIGLDLVGTTGVALRNQLTLLENSSDIYEYDASTEEEDVINPTYYSDRKGTRPPLNLSTEIIEEDNGGSITQSIKILFDPSPSSTVTAYDFQFREVGGVYADLPDIDITSIESGQVMSTTTPVNPTKNYDLRVRSIGLAGNSVWVEIAGVSIDFELTSVSGTGGVGQASFTVTTPSTNFKGINTYRNTVGGTFATATQQGTTEEYGGGTSVTHLVSGQPIGSYDYWLVPVTNSNTEGSEDGPHTITIT